MGRGGGEGGYCGRWGSDSGAERGGCGGGTATAAHATRRLLPPAAAVRVAHSIYLPRPLRRAPLPPAAAHATRSRKQPKSKAAHALRQCGGLLRGRQRRSSSSSSISWLAPLWQRLCINARQLAPRRHWLAKHPQSFVLLLLVCSMLVVRPRG